jgi:hypothetical protein
LIKFTPKDHSDLSNVETALRKINAVVALVNDKTRASTERERLVEIQSRIDAQPPIDLASSPTRKFLREGAIQQMIDGKLKDRYLFLFSDTVLVCKIQTQIMGRARFAVQHKLDLKTLTTIADLPTPNMFEFLVTDKQDKFIISCSSEADKIKWIALVKDKTKSGSHAAHKTPDSSLLGALMGAKSSKLKRGNSLLNKRLSLVRSTMRQTSLTITVQEAIIIVGSVTRVGG